MLLLLLLSRFSYVRLYVTLWTAAHQAPLSAGSLGKNTGVGCHFLLQPLPYHFINVSFNKYFSEFYDLL